MAQQVAKKKTWLEKREEVSKRADWYLSMGLALIPLGMLLMTIGFVTLIPKSLRLLGFGILILGFISCFVLTPACLKFSAKLDRERLKI